MNKRHRRTSAGTIRAIRASFRTMSRGFGGALVVWLVTNPGLTSHAAGLLLPNFSFESPVTPFVNTHIDSWQKPPKPDWYSETNGFLWDQLAGVFKNTPITSADHIDNCDSNQAAYIFAVQEVTLFQDYDSIDWRSPTPTHEFNAIYEPGKSYSLTLGVIGGGGGMLEGVTLEVSFYYRDSASNRVTVAAMSITNSTAIFSNNTHLLDFQVQVPTVQPGDAWATQNIGVQLQSTVSSNLAGGYWDVDNLRLVSFAAPVMKDPMVTNGLFQFTLTSEPGIALEILAATNPAAPDWTSLGLVTNTTGTTPFAVPTTNFGRRFVRARTLP